MHVDKFTFSLGWLAVFRLPRHVSAAQIENMTITLPPHGEKANSAPKSEGGQPGAVPEGKLQAFIGEIERRASLFEPPHRLASCSWVGLRLAELLPLPLEAKQEYLEMTDARARLERLNSLLTNAQAAS